MTKAKSKKEVTNAQRSRSPTAPGTEAGVKYVTSWGQIINQSDIGAAELMKFRTNVYAKGVERRQQCLIFTERPIINVLDGDGNPDDAVRDRITEMCHWDEVDLESKMVMAWNEILWYGAALFNPVWEQEGSEIVLRKLRHLPSDSFTSPPQGVQTIYSPILQGIVLEDGELAFYQMQSLNDIAPTRLDTENAEIIMIKEPTEPGLAGSPIIVPLVPVLKMMNYAWDAQMQKGHRVAAPIVFIKVTNGTEEDETYAKNILKKWGKSTSFVLRGNMELVRVDIPDNPTAMDIINALNQLLIEFFSPASSITKEGTLIGGSDWGAAELVKSYIMGIHRWLESAFQKILQEYLDYNGYEDLHVTIALPSPSIDRANIMLQQASVGAQQRVLSINEVRRKLEVEELDEEGLAQIAQEWDAFGPIATSFPMSGGFGAQGATADSAPYAMANGCGGGPLLNVYLPKPRSAERATRKDLGKDVDQLRDEVLDALAQQDVRSRSEGTSDV